MPDDVNLSKVVFVSFLNCEVTFCPLHILYSFEVRHKVQPSLKVWGVKVHHLVKEYLYTLFGILYRFVSPLSFIYSIIYISMYSWIFILYFGF